jgi:hypothetical protein
MMRSGTPSRSKNRLVACRDVAGRRRNIVVFADGDRIVLTAPPGETAILEPFEVGELRAALRDSASETTA